jgi:hypothetical protein
MVRTGGPIESTWQNRATADLRTCAELLPLVLLPHYLVYLDRICNLCVAQRTRVPFERVDDIAACFDAIQRALAPVRRAEYKLLVDTRNGPSRNDPSFEAAVAKHRGKLLFRFAKNVALASTAAGRLQIQRYAKSDGRVVFATDEPRAAFDYLGLPVHSF